MRNSNGNDSCKIFKHLYKFLEVLSFHLRDVVSVAILLDGVIAGQTLGVESKILIDIGEAPDVNSVFGVARSCAVLIILVGIGSCIAVIVSSATALTAAALTAVFS